MQSIPESELIINKRGAIYHLDLRPEELAPTIITVGDPDRVDRVSRHFDAIEHRSHHREFVSHTGRIGKKRLTVVSTGIGTDNIDIVLNELDALANIDFSTRTVRKTLTPLTIIRVGTSGALQHDIPVDHYVASTHGLVASAGKSAYVASKHGVIGLTKSIALETATTPITCNAICPGWVLTPLVQQQILARVEAGASPDEARHDLLAEKQPSREFVTPEQLGELAVFLCSEAAAQVRGAAWNMDGGWVAQ